MSTELFQLLLLIIIANGSPIFIRVLCNDSFNLAVDFDQSLSDKQRIFGSSKTWRGVIASLTATSAIAWLLGYSLVTGLLIAVYAVIGDLISSFIKRRLAMTPSTMAPLLDQMPESLLPALMLMKTFHLELMSVILLVFMFIIIELFLSRTLYKWGIRKHPY